jgi:murein DD-endopeptidase MepM/ murein hydrolase activator NlpD
MSIRLVPQTLNPGDLFYLEVHDVAGNDVKARFLDREIRLYRSSDGSFMALVPVSIDTPAGEYFVEVSAGERPARYPVRVTSKSFRKIELTLPERTVTLSAADRKRVEREYILQQNIWKTASSREWEGTFILPLDSGVSTEFGVRRIMNKKKTSIHRGMDFRGKKGTPVRAINNGSVVLAKELFYGGKTLIIDHGMGLFSVYMHLSRIDVKEGARVEKGQVVGLVGMSGRATGPHLHLSVKLNGDSVNPEALFRLKL